MFFAAYTIYIRILSNCGNLLESVMYFFFLLSFILVVTISNGGEYCVCFNRWRQLFYCSFFLCLAFFLKKRIFHYERYRCFECFLPSRLCCRMSLDRDRRGFFKNSSDMLEFGVLCGKKYYVHSSFTKMFTLPFLYAQMSFLYFSFASYKLSKFQDNVTDSSQKRFTIVKTFNQRTSFKC